MKTETEFDALLYELIAGTRIAGREINDGTNSVFVDVTSKAIPTCLEGSFERIGGPKYDLKYTLRAYHSERGQAEYECELV